MPESPALPTYGPKGKEGWDFWFAKEGETYFAFYLQAPLDAGNLKWNTSTVGLASGTDLVGWRERGEILAASAETPWNNSHIATGSVWKIEETGRWAMLFSAWSQGEEFPSAGLAESDDLLHWKKWGPAEMVYREWTVPSDPYWQQAGLAAGEKIRHRLLADPYVLPEPVDGWHWMIANCVIEGKPVNGRGCLGSFRSRDGKRWEDCGISALLLDYDRAETPCVWRGPDGWYLYIGGAREGDAFCRHNLILKAAQLEGPFELLPQRTLSLPDGQEFYIGKVLADPAGKPVLLGAHDFGRITLPYPVIYGANGSVSLGMPPRS